MTAARWANNVRYCILHYGNQRLEAESLSFLTEFTIYSNLSVAPYIVQQKPFIYASSENVDTKHEIWT